MYRQILVPLDGSGFAETAIPLALRLSRSTGATVQLASVIEPGPVFTGQKRESEAKKRTREYLDGVVARISEHAGGEVTTALLAGRVVDALLDEANRCAADVVVMATHGRGVLSRMWLGSVAEGLLRETKRPMLLVRPDAEDAPIADWNVEKLLIPLDGSPLSEHALDHATELGEVFDAAYHLTSVVTYTFDIASPSAPHPSQVQAKEDAAEYLEKVAETMRSRGLRVTTSVAAATQVGQGILTEATAAGCGAIAMATHARTGISRAMLGSAADKVLRGGSLPILLYRPEDAANASGEGSDA